MDYHADCQAGLAVLMIEHAGLEQGLADDLAAWASCGQAVEFTTETRVCLPQRDGSTVELLQNVTLWRATADKTWTLRKVGA